MKQKSRTDGDPRVHAVKAVIERHGADDVRKPTVGDDFSLSQGTVFRVDFDSRDGTAFHNYVYFDGRDYRVFIRSRDLIQFIARAPQSAAARILQIAGVPGLIATVITITICYLAIQREQIPEVLGHALTAILGFYFAASVYESSKKRNG